MEDILSLWAPLIAHIDQTQFCLAESTYSPHLFSPFVCLTLSQGARASKALGGNTVSSLGKGGCSGEQRREPGNQQYNLSTTFRPVDSLSHILSPHVVHGSTNVQADENH
jgi:hypothetical protein